MNLFHSENCKLCDYSSYFVDLFYCSPKEGKGGADFLSESTCKLYDHSCYFVEKAVGGYKLEGTKEERGKTKEELLLKKEKAARKKGTSRKGKNYSA